MFEAVLLRDTIRYVPSQSQLTRLNTLRYIQVRALLHGFGSGRQTHLETNGWQIRKENSADADAKDDIIKDSEIYRRTTIPKCSCSLSSHRMVFMQSMVSLPEVHAAVLSLFFDFLHLRNDDL